MTEVSYWQIFGGFYRSKLHNESRLIQRIFDDNKGDDKKLKG